MSEILWEYVVNEVFYMQQVSLFRLELQGSTYTFKRNSHFFGKMIKTKTGSDFIIN